MSRYRAFMPSGLCVGSAPERREVVLRVEQEGVVCDRLQLEPEVALGLAVGLASAALGVAPELSASLSPGGPAEPVPEEEWPQPDDIGIFAWLRERASRGSGGVP